MNNDDQKIAGTNGINTDTQNPPSVTDTDTQSLDTSILDDSLLWKTPTVSQEPHPLDGTPVSDSDSDSVSDVRSEIEKMLSGDTDDMISSSDTQSALSTAEPIASLDTIPVFNIKDEIDKILKQQDSTQPDVDTLPETMIESEDDTQNTIEALKSSIHSDINQSPITPESSQPNTRSVGIEQTYYGDVSGAMGSNKPATMAELLRKARFEKKEAAILSPTSKRNLLFIIGGVILLLLAFFLLWKVFQSEKQVEFITEKRVDSLVFSNLDTGLNITDIGAEKTKQAIRKAIETDIDDDSINQIYYVSEDEYKNLRRLNIKQVFDATEHTPPQLLYENIESDFMHGVYKTDENHPFLILKSVSYDKVFEGMKQWEPTMIDDLATYLDLPEEALDRSLIQDGFYDDIINNKNVRVARFIPREKDRSLIERIGDKIIQTSTQLFTTAYAQSLYTVYGKVIDKNTKQSLAGVTVFARDINKSVVTNLEGNYNIALPITAGAHQLEFRKDTYNLQTFNVTKEFNLNVSLSPFVLDAGQTSGNSANFDGLVCYQNTKRCIDQNGNAINSAFEGTFGVTCYDELKNGPNDKTFDSSFADTEGYSCFRVVGTNNYIGANAPVSTLRTDDVCFHSVTGEKVNTTDRSQPTYMDPLHPLVVCFRSYECRRVACFNSANQEVSLDQEGKPGITCKESFDLVSPDYEGRKVCREYSELRLINNISDSEICFDQNGKFVQGSSATAGAVNCISSNTRNQLLCMNAQKQIIIPDPGVPLPGMPGSPFVLCFPPLESASQGSLNVTTGTLNDKFVTSNQQMREIAAAIARRLEIIAALASLTGMDAEKVQTLSDASQFFYSIAYVDVLSNEHIKQALTFVKTLEDILNFVDPTGTLQQPGPDGELNVFGKLNYVIDIIKDVFGMSHTVLWRTLGNELPKGGAIYAGESGPGVGAVQSVLVNLGLMEAISVTQIVDLVTQNAILEFQTLNNLEATGIIDTYTLEFMGGMVEAGESLYGDGSVGTIDDYLDPTGPLSGEGAIGLGSYSADVQALQILLYAEGYDINGINGIFDPQTCEALMQYQDFNDLVLANPDGGCYLSVETVESLNALIRDKNYLGSGFAVGSNGFLEGVGSLSGRVGPGVISFVNSADAASLREGDIVLMYTFLDEQTILITRHESVITEIIKRRALDDIFNQS